MKYQDKTKQMAFFFSVIPETYSFVKEKKLGDDRKS